jgi:hypothetical protein
MRGVWLSLAFIIGGSFMVGVTLTRLVAQEKDPSYPQTRQWQIGSLYSNGTYATGAVVVFDTAGVCLYVVTSRIDGVSPFKGGSEGQIHTIAAVPKTQLPKGAGCQ